MKQDMLIWSFVFYDSVIIQIAVLVFIIGFYAHNNKVYATELSTVKFAYDVKKLL